MTLILLLNGGGVSTPIVVDASVVFTVIVPPDDMSVTVPEEATVHIELRTEAYYLTDHSGNKLTDHSNNYLVATFLVEEETYAYEVHVPPDDMSVIVPEET